MTTVSGIVRDTEQNAIAGASVSVVYRKPLVGFNGGAAVQNVRQFTTAGDGTLTMADLVPGHYDITIAIVANDSTTETVLRKGTMTVLDQETQTLQNALDASFEPITPSDVQRAEAAAAAAEADRILAQTAAATATTQAGNAATSASEANTSATQAELAALAAGAPIVTTLTDPVPANGTVELLKLDAGLQVYEVVAGAWVLRGWLVGPKFDTVQALLDDTSTTLGPTGTIVEAGGFRYEVVTTGEHVTTSGGVKLKVLARQGWVLEGGAFGIGANDGTTDESAQLIAALSAALSVSPVFKGRVELAAGLRVYLSSTIVIPVGVALVFDDVDIISGASEPFKINNRSSLVGRNGRISASTTSKIIKRENESAIVSQVELTGFDIVGSGFSGANHYAVDMSGFYECNINLGSISNVRIAFFQSGSIQCYYNRVQAGVTNSGYFLLSTGALFNGNYFVLFRCNVKEGGIRCDLGTGNTFNLTYIEGNYTLDGIVFNGTGGNTIVGGVVETGTLTTGFSIRLAGETEGTTIIGTRFGGAGDASTKRLNAGSNVKNTTYIGPAGTILNRNGPITRIDGDSTLVSGPMRVTEAVAADGDTSPDVAGVGFISLSNTSATTVTNFVNADVDQELIVFATNANTTLANGSGINIIGGADLAIPSNGMVTLKKYTGSSAWRIVSKNFS